MGVFVVAVFASPLFCLVVRKCGKYKKIISINKTGG